MNLFDNPDGTFSVLVNGEEQYSLWPTALSVPAGWTVVHGESSRQACVDYIERNWTDLRPRSARHDGAAVSTGQGTR
ncbi:MbtH family protein [Streptomyces sp. NPDC127066]|uniref:MbtH family protein n=1 Tax=Streptomyces sp. NPDC127066 TaxID=3347125 RepID=UPI00364DD53B